MVARSDHEARYLELIERDGTWKTDVERHALLYILASDMLYSNASSLYDFNKRWIKPDKIGSLYLSSSAVKMTELAFNLYNGSSAKDPLTIFRSLDPENFRICMEAIQIRFLGTEKNRGNPTLTRLQEKQSEELKR